MLNALRRSVVAIKNTRCISSVKMTPSEAFVETLRINNTKNVFGIVGSAFMDPLHSFPTAGIRFISVQHEQNAAHMADGFSRISGECGVCIGQNGPGISNMVTGIASAYWSHSPVVMISPQASTSAEGLGTFQELDQMSLFSKITKYQVNISNPARMMELVNNGFKYAKLYNGPSQINIPRDLFFNEYEYTYPSIPISSSRIPWPA